MCIRDSAYRVNALGARNLSIVARKNGAKIVQLSTDDVFDGQSKKPYTEFDDTNPLTVYGASKRAGENYVKEFTHKHFIIRSNWVYGKGGNNFVNRVLEVAEQGKTLSVAGDQFGSPTSAKDLARMILYLISTNEYGTYHAVSYTHLRAHETDSYLVCRLLLEKKKKNTRNKKKKTHTTTKKQDQK